MKSKRPYIKCWTSGLGGCGSFCPSNCGTKRCRVKGCTFPNCIIDALPHFCNICKNKNSTHFSKNCPYKKILDMTILIKIVLFLLIIIFINYIL